MRLVGVIPNKSGFYLTIPQDFGEGKEKGEKKINIWFSSYIFHPSHTM